MATTVDDLISLKDEAVSVCYEIHEWESSRRDLGDLAAIIARAKSVVESSEEYDSAEEDEDAVSVEDWRETREETER